MPHEQPLAVAAQVWVDRGGRISADDCRDKLKLKESLLDIAALKQSRKAKHQAPLTDPAASRLALGQR
jgi:hypothetical protein